MDSWDQYVAGGAQTHLDSMRGGAGMSPFGNRAEPMVRKKNSFRLKGRV
jgi:hypothetical protein